MKTYGELAEKCTPLTDEELAHYKQHSMNKDYFSPKNFRVDFSQPWTTFSFNVEARDYFIRHLIHTLRGGKYKDKFAFPERYWTPYHIGASLDAHMEHVRQELRKKTNPKSDYDPEEDAKNARMRARRLTVSLSERIVSHCRLIILY